MALDLSLSKEETDRFLTAQRTIRLATATTDGQPHVVPLWFVWVDGTVFMNSTLGNVTIRNLQSNPPVTGSIDDGDAYEELRGVLVHGRVEWADDDPRLDLVKRAWSDKYMGGGPVPYDRWKDRIWFRVKPDRVVTWDFRRIPEAKARAKATARGEAARG